VIDIGRRKSTYCPNIDSVRFISCGTNEDTTIMLQNIILNHLKKDGIITDVIISSLNKTKSVYELQKDNVPNLLKKDKK
jgi:hypothetical protein